MKKSVTVSDSRKSYREGMACALTCSLWWGIMPIYWQWLRPIDSAVIIFYRIVLVALVSLIACLILYDKKTILAPLAEKKTVVKYALAGVLITANWSIYIWAVNADYVIQTCIGYYIEPVVVCLFGIVIFKERLSKYKAIALAFAAAGIAAVIVYFGEVPLIALGIALTFAVYAAAKKKFTLPPVLSLLYETVFLMPIALAVIIYIEATGQGAIGNAAGYKYALLMLCGLFTAFPLVLFANAASKLNLFVVGLTEYISPTISLMIGIFLFKEPFESIQLIAFAIIWTGLIFFSYGEFKDYISKGADTGAAERTDAAEADTGAVSHSDAADAFDPFAYPAPLTRVTAGPGGEAILIKGSEKNALYDCGMSCFGPKLVENIERELAGAPLDYVLLSHTHYDHVGGLPYVLARWPKAMVCGNKKAETVLARSGARATMERLGRNAAALYGEDVNLVRTDGLRIDRLIKSGDVIELGGVSVLVIETGGHTDCSISYLIQPQGILLASESAGYIAGGSVMPEAVKSHEDALESAAMLELLPYKMIVIPHYGMVEEKYRDDYFAMCRQALQTERELVNGWIRDGLDREEMIKRHSEIFWSKEKSEDHPYEAYLMNLEYMLERMQREFKENEKS